MIGPQEFTRAFTHNSPYSDDSYGYASKYDELQHTASFTQQIRDELSAADTGSAGQFITPMRLERLQADPHSHLIGTHSVCQEKNCTPEFMRCVFCESYLPDPQFIPDAEQCCAILQQRIERCRTVGDSAAVQFNEKQLSAYSKFIQRAEERKGGDTYGGSSRKF